MASPRRRAFVGALLAAPLAARAQPARVPAIGYLNGFSEADWRLPLASFKKGLAERGYVEGHQVSIEYRWADGTFDRLPALAADLVRRRVDVLVATGGTITAVAARDATKSIPVVFGIGTDPAKAGIVATLNRPGGNVTGVYFLTSELEGKRLGILRELVPGAPMIGVFVNPKVSTFQIRLQEIETTGAAVKQALHVVRASDEREIEAGFAALAQMHAAAVQVAADPYFLTRRDLFAALAARYAMPAIYEQREFAESGGLMSYGTSLDDANREVGVYAGRVLDGERPGDLPVLLSAKFELVINLKAAKALKIAIPQSLTLRADDVIE
jgi:putative ABC transport system substrate-binding protein